MVEELQAFLGAGPYERAENRKGYRHGFETRRFSNSKNRRSQLLTFFSYPKAQWKSLRSTNIIERMYVEFRRRIKTQASLPSENAVLSILYGLFASGYIRMYRIRGWRDMPKVTSKPLDKAA